MTFEDLPPRANEIPLTNRRVAADVIDLIISDANRAAGCVAVMICDSEHRGIQPIVLHDVPPDAEAGGFASCSTCCCRSCRERRWGPHRRGRRHGTAPNDPDRSWHQMAIDRCSDHEVALLATTSQPPTASSGSPNRSRRPPEIVPGDWFRRAGDRSQRLDSDVLSGRAEPAPPRRGPRRASPSGRCRRREQPWCASELDRRRAARTSARWCAGCGAPGLAGQVRDLRRTVWPRDVVVEVAPSGRHRAAWRATGAVDGFDVGAHGCCRLVGTRLEMKCGAGVGVDSEASPGRAVVEHDLACVCSRRPSRGHAPRTVASVRPMAVVNGTTRVMAAAGRRPRRVPLRARALPGARTGCWEPCAARGRCGVAGGPAEHQGFGDDVGAERVQVAGSPACRAARAMTSTRSIAAMTLSASMTRLRTPRPSRSICA